MTVFPIRVSADPEDTTDVKPLSEILAHKETLHNMYLIGEGGIGKTTALNSIMEDTYRDNAYHPEENGKNIIPLFVELSKAPADYCSAYHASHSTFIQRYLYMLLGSVDKRYLLSENAEECHESWKEKILPSWKVLSSFCVPVKVIRSICYFWMD